MRSDDTAEREMARSKRAKGSSETSGPMQNSSNHGMGIFAVAGPRMQRQGFAVMPANGKAPLMAGFPKWETAPSAAAVKKWAIRNPDADLVYVPGLSRGRRGDPIVVVDGDDHEACSRIIELFGDTPGKVCTRRGKHFLYRDTGQGMGKVQSLKNLGLNADLKHGRSVVVAPPSRHEKDRTFSYAWDSCDETVIRDLPPFNTTALRALIEAADPRMNNSTLCDSRSVEPSLNLSTQCNLTAPAPRPPGSTQHKLLHKDSRGLGLNKWLVGKIGTESVDSLDDLLFRAQAFNSLLVENGHDALGDLELIARTSAVWTDFQNGKIERREGRPSIARTDAQEIKDLSGRKNGGDAVALLLLLRCEHAARMSRGETFALNVKAMVERETMPGWTFERFRNAIRTLIEANKLKIVQPHRNDRGGRKAAQFTLLGLGPS